MLITLSFFSANLFGKEIVMKDKIIRLPLLTAQLTPEKTVEKIEIKKINFLPLQKTGIHTHPCPVVGYVTKGKIYFQIKNESAKVINEGDAFFEPANVEIIHFDNISKSDPAIFIAYYLLGKSDKELIKML